MRGAFFSQSRFIFRRGFLLCGGLFAGYFKKMEVLFPAFLFGFPLLRADANGNKPSALVSLRKTRILKEFFSYQREAASDVAELFSPLATKPVYTNKSNVVIFASAGAGVCGGVC